MNIWIINQYAHPSSDGGGRHLAYARELATMGHNVLIVASTFNHNTRSRRNSKGMTPEEDRIDFLALNTIPYGGGGAQRLRSMLHFGRQVRRLNLTSVTRPDVIIGSSPHPFAARGAQQLAKRLRVPFILEVRDIWPLSLQELAGVPRYHPALIGLGILEKLLYSSASAIIGTMPGLAIRVHERVGDQAPAVFWLPTSLADNDLVESTQPGPTSTFNVVYAGSHGVPNSLDTLLDAAHLLHPDRIRTHDGRSFAFHLYGHGHQKEVLKRRAHERSDNHVHFHDPVPRAEVPKLLSRADTTVICWQRSKLYDYGVSPNKLNDYILAERPIIQALSSQVETVTRGNGGIQVDAENPQELADAILKVSQMSNAERSEMTACALAYRLQFHDPGKNGRALADFLTRVIRETIV